MTDNPNPHIDEAIRLAGSQVALARALGVGEPAISGWVSRGWVPLERAKQMEVLFGVDRKKLVNPRIRELLQLA